MLPREVLTERLDNLVTAGVLRKTEDGRYTRASNFRLGGDNCINTWILVKINPKMDCFLHHQITFNHFRDYLTSPPIYCQSCWKLVAAPREIRRFPAIIRRMEMSGHVSKMGIETRPHVNRSYGVYLYFRRKDKALETLLDLELESDFGSIICKRSCTEMEYYFGPSDKWEAPTFDQLKTELSLAKAIRPNPFEIRIPPMEQWESVKNEWFAFSHGRGDLSYMEINAGQRLFPEVVKYEYDPEQ